MGTTHADEELHLVFIPFLAPGHMNPMVDMARLFAAHGVTSTVITTPYNAHLFQNSIKRDISVSGHPIRFQTVELPREEYGLPKGVENLANIIYPQMAKTLYDAMVSARGAIEQMIRDLKPDCIVSDAFYHWTIDIALELNVPRLSFRGSNFFYSCAENSLKIYAPQDKVESSTDTFELPGLPHKIEMTRLQIPGWVTTKGPYRDLMVQVDEVERRSYGNLVNSFAELEPDYEEHFKSCIGLKSWSIGPLSLWANKDSHDKVDRGNLTVVGNEHVLTWLDTKAPESVIYVCFGTLIKLPPMQIKEIAQALEACGHDFILVIRKTYELANEEWLPNGFERRMEETGKGYIIYDWAPQLLILEHPAVGAFVTHCGWNSILEGVCSGLPMITWPLASEQLYNEKLVRDVLKIGVSIGVSRWTDNNTPDTYTEVISRDKVQKAIALTMDDGDESAVIRKRVKLLKDAANEAIDCGGSSHSNLQDLINELKLEKHKNKIKFTQDITM